ncbi:DUF6134 family protein [Dongia rigui]|uniref:DUF6134 family protein n=1 Tax=Dongia rigui TaxID=940149 RepID=A0ABU5E2B8_9PROT|nr:DUF6134 family protein [Dongia rigui]MDY0873364.1 DUF6134 family protein [Dongia rigui]
MADGMPVHFVDPVTLYGPEARYEILRNGDAVGEHLISFQRHGDTIIAEARSKIAVPFLFMTAYRFDYHSRSVWRAGAMVDLDAVTSDDGDTSQVSIEQLNGKLRVTGSAGSTMLSTALPPTEHWSKSFISQGEIINTITGRVNEVRLSKLSDAFVPTATGMARADRYTLAGDLNLETWYDAEGRWLGMRFQGKDGSMIEYRCRDCPAQLATAQ